MTCKGCGRRPDQIHEYVIEAMEYGITPEQFVRKHEGTVNLEDGTFLCTACYFKAHQAGTTA